MQTVASSATVGRWNSSCNANEMPLARAAPSTRMLRIESPPRWKKLSCRPTWTGPSAATQISASRRSTGPSGAT